MVEKNQSSSDVEKSNMKREASEEEVEPPDAAPIEEAHSAPKVWTPDAATYAKEHLLVELMATLSHEFRTPLTVINGYTSTLLNKGQKISPQEQQEFLQIIQQAGKHLELLTARLLEIAQLETGLFRIDPHLVDIPSLAREAITVAEHQIPEPMRQRFSFHLQCRDEAGNQVEEVPLIMGDVHSLRKVLDYLLENAIRYSPEGGRIDIITWPVTQGSLVDTHSRPHLSSSFLEICVCDFGLGIPDEHLERIFEHFYRVDSSLNREVYGLGLGLTVCKHLVALHQGHIWAESCPAGGSAFHVQLPLEQAPILD